VVDFYRSAVFSRHQRANGASSSTTQRNQLAAFGAR
jgi:hypothetical protein